MGINDGSGTGCPAPASQRMAGRVVTGASSVGGAVAMALLLLVVPGHMSAQFANIVLGTGGDERPNPAVVINRKDPRNIVAASSPANRYRSVDSGKTWENSLITSTEGVGGSNVLASDRKGDLFNFHLSRNPATGRSEKIVCQVSKDNGMTWEEAGNSGTANVDVLHPAIGMNSRSGEFLLLWTQFDQYGSADDAHKSMIMLSQSKEGKKWSEPVRLTSSEGDCSNGDRTPRGGTAVVSRDGYMVAAWSQNERLFVDRSFNKGGTWLTNDIEIEKQPGGWSFDIPGLEETNGMPTLLIDKTSDRYAGSLYLIWADQRNGEDDTDIWFSRSLNYGDSWTPAMKINDDEKGSHQFMPAVAIDQTTGNLYIVYYDRRAYDDDRTDVYLAYSKDHGNTFSNVKISEAPFKTGDAPSLGDYIGIDASNGIVVPVWTRIDEGISSIIATVIKEADLTATTEAE